MVAVSRSPRNARYRATSTTSGIKKAITNIICLKNLIKCYRVMYDSKVDSSFVVHCGAQGLSDLLFEMHLCGLHVCYPKQMVEFGFVQTVEDNMKLYSKRQISGAVQAREFFEKMIYPSTLNLKVIVSAGDIPGCKVTPENVKTVEVIWGCLVLKIKGNTVRKNAKCMMQSIIMVPKELIKLQQDVEIATDCFFISKHTFFTTYSIKLCLPHNNASYL
jgi:hypothetical protein